MAERFGRPRGRRALEPACGSGRLVDALAARDWKVQGFDLSRPMLDHARARLARSGRSARLFEARMEDFRARGTVDLAHCLVSTFKYLLSEAHARAHLECVARSLAPGGVYVLGFHLSEYEVDKRTRERWVVRDGKTEVVCNIQSWPPDGRTRLERVRSRLRVTEGGRERRTETYWNFRTYDARQVRRLLRSVPALEHVATYDFTYDLTAPRELDDDQLDLVLVLRKRGS
ncbi:MAG: class I SAM-dependent methyltransferase [Planctomycetes bacterium]|nr:class I SAM-dependent methyltransferase [Planctomycetota bacterium]